MNTTLAPIATKACLLAAAVLLSSGLTTGTAQAKVDTPIPAPAAGLDAVPGHVVQVLPSDITGAGCVVDAAALPVLPTGGRFVC